MSIDQHLCHALIRRPGIPGVGDIESSVVNFGDLFNLCWATTPRSAGGVAPEPYFGIAIPEKVRCYLFCNCVRCRERKAICEIDKLI